MEIIDTKKIVTPCFILDKDELVRSIDGFQQALKSNFHNPLIGYSVKTNSLPYCLHVAKEYGCLAEVVSEDEYNLALLCGFAKDQIIYNGPMKSRKSFIDAITNGAIVNIETHRELDWLAALPKGKMFRVGLRLNVDISEVSPDDADGENDCSRFGFSDRTDEFRMALKVIRDLPNVELSGLHIHRTARSRSIRFYRNSINYACKTIEKYGLNPDYLDVGGGFFGFFPDKPTFRQYSDAFKEVLSKHNLDHLQVIVEPGNALVASCFSFLSEVIDVKHVKQNCWFVVTDGSRNDVDPFYRKTTYSVELITNAVGKVVDEQIVSGCTCLECDRLFTIKDKSLLSVGDRILYKNVGAYTMCLTPLFIRYFPIVYVREGNRYEVVRDKWSANEYMQKSNY